MQANYELTPTRDAVADEEATYRKVTWRLLPFLMVCYIVGYLDRVNVGFAKLQMQGDLGFSSTVYGLGAGLFFIGYFVFEVPSNVILHKVGARRWIARIMVTWGLISAASLLVRTPQSFYIMRFLLGAAEAGFYPGILLYLTYWYPSARRARIVALFMSAIPISMMIGSPLSGWIMESFSGHGGLAGWQWMYLLEGVPAVLLGIAVFVRLDDSISAAKWLDPEEKRLLAERVAHDDRTKVSHPSLGAVLKDRRLLLMGCIYFSCTMSQTGLGMWVPSLVSKVGVKSLLAVGLVSAMPYFIAAVCMWFVGVHADRRRERRWHFAIPAFVGALGLLAIPFSSGSLVWSFLAITLGAVGAVTASAMFWSIPTAIFGGVSAAAALALVNSVGNLGGFVGPFVVGWLVDVTRSTNAGMMALAGILLAGGVLALLAVPARLVNK